MSMNFFAKYGGLIKELNEVANPIIKYRIDKEIYGKEDISIEDYFSSEDNDLIDYWLNILNDRKIHGREDCVFENAIAKLLDFGFTKHNKEFDDRYRIFLDDRYWIEDSSFEGTIMQIVMYPFLIRAGYYNNKNIKNFLHKRVKTIEKTIEKYKYDFALENERLPKKYRDSLVFRIDSQDESLPTIYDLYAFAFYPNIDDEISARIEKIVDFLLDERYQNIPKKAYIYDSAKKRYYAAGNVYHACIIEERKLLTIYLLSHFKAVGKSKIFMYELCKLNECRKSNGFFDFEKKFIKETRDSYYIYSGSHMGLGERRTRKSCSMIESSFWMAKILINLEKSCIEI